jgi:hypothetical protein
MRMRGRTSRAIYRASENERSSGIDAAARNHVILISIRPISRDVVWRCVTRFSDTATRGFADRSHPAKRKRNRKDPSSEESESGDFSRGSHDGSYRSAPLIDSVAAQEVKRDIVINHSVIVLFFPLSPL